MTKEFRLDIVNKETGAIYQRDVIDGDFVATCEILENVFETEEFSSRDIISIELYDLTIPTGTEDAYLIGEFSTLDIFPLLENIMGISKDIKEVE